MAEECPHCGSSFDPKGLATHKKACGQRALAALQATASASSSRAGTPAQSQLALPGSEQGKRRRADGEEGEPQEAVRDLEEKTAQTFGQASQKVAEHDLRLQMMEAENAEMKQMVVISSLMGMVTAGEMPQGSRALGFADLREGRDGRGFFQDQRAWKCSGFMKTRFERVGETRGRKGSWRTSRRVLLTFGPGEAGGGSFGDVQMVAVVDRAIARLVALQFGEETEGMRACSRRHWKNETCPGRWRRAGEKQGDKIAELGAMEQDHVCAAGGKIGYLVVHRESKTVNRPTRRNVCLRGV
ncbi:hypothetical protein DIPPA_16618 [Diplonema papillatum]|nr:hypothetical protein DIPPA_16618 [Diplonema papillatum]